MRTRSNNPYEGSASQYTPQLGHYSCHWFLRRWADVRSSPFRPPTSHSLGYPAPRGKLGDTARYPTLPPYPRHLGGRARAQRSATQLFRTAFSGTVAATLAVVRLGIRLARKQATDDSDDITLRSPGCIPHLPCDG